MEIYKSRASNLNFLYIPHPDLSLFKTEERCDNFFCEFFLIGFQLFCTNHRHIGRIIAIFQIFRMLHSKIYFFCNFKIFQCFLYYFFYFFLHYFLPVEPNLPSPRADSLSVSVSSSSTISTGKITSCATLSPSSNVYGSLLKFTRCVLYSPL